MTNETELRDGIADKIADENCCYVCRDGAMRAAQAIIDEFELEVVSGGGRPGQRQQIVGKWEDE